MTRFILKHRRLVGWIGTGVALGIALFYLIVIPEEATQSGGINRFLLTYGHSLCWLLLAGASASFALGFSAAVSRAFAYGALSFYALFMITLIAMQLR